MSNYYSNKGNKSLPAMLKCSADGRLEQNSMFSNNMLKKRSFNPNALITCRKHTSGAITEILCSSCNKHKPIDYFSKNERKATGNQRCRACVEWTEADEAGHTPLPAPNTVRDALEKQVYHGHPSHKAAYHSPTDGDYVTDAQGGGGMWLARSTETTGAETGDGLTITNLKNFDKAGNGYPASSRGSYHASSAPTDSVSTTGTEGTARPGNAREFNAWGPNGQFQKRQAGTASSVASATSRTSAGSKAWAKPATRKFAPDLPRHMEHENPNIIVDDAFDDDDSSDGC